MQSTGEIYLVCYSIGRLGDIIAGNATASRNNFFDIYRFSNVELEHTKRNLKDMSCRAFISLTKSGKYALFLRSSSSSVAMLVCVIDKESVADLIRYDADIRISEHAMPRCVGVDAPVGKDMRIKYLIDICTALAHGCSRMDTYIQLLSKVYCVDVDISYSDGGSAFWGKEAVLSEDMLDIFLHAVMMSASMCYTDKVRFNIINSNELCMILSVIKADDRTDILRTCDMLKYISDILCTEFMYTCNDDIRLLLCPYFEDSGRIGLKTDMHLLFNINK